jgi:hypothetical protein
MIVVILATQPPQADPFRLSFFQNVEIPLPVEFRPEMRILFLYL